MTKWGFYMNIWWLGQLKLENFDSKDRKVWVFDFFFDLTKNFNFFFLTKDQSKYLVETSEGVVQLRQAVVGDLDWRWDRWLLWCVVELHWHPSDPNRWPNWSRSVLDESRSSFYIPARITNDSSVGQFFFLPYFDKKSIFWQNCALLRSKFQYSWSFGMVGSICHLIGTHFDNFWPFKPKFG